MNCQYALFKYDIHLFHFLSFILIYLSSYSIVNSFLYLLLYTIPIFQNQKHPLNKIILLISLFFSLEFVHHECFSSFTLFFIYFLSIFMLFPHFICSMLSDCFPFSCLNYDCLVDPFAIIFLD